MRGKLAAGDVDYVDKLTHALKSTKATIAMMEEEGGEEYSGYYPGMNGVAYRGSYRGRMNARRDSMGRYSGERGYSRAGLADELRDLMREAPEEHKQDFQRLIDKMER